MIDAMARDFNVIIERDSEGFYVASVPSLRGCHTQARSLDELMERVREAIELCLEVEEDEAAGESLDFVGVQRVTVG
jgi:predicted RNase H-like HicB family nuclease